MLAVLWSALIYCVHTPGWGGVLPLRPEQGNTEATDPSTGQAGAEPRVTLYFFGCLEEMNQLTLAEGLLWARP